MFIDVLIKQTDVIQDSTNWQQNQYFKDSAGCIMQIITRTDDGYIIVANGSEMQIGYNDIRNSELLPTVAYLKKNRRNALKQQITNNKNINNNTKSNNNNKNNNINVTNVSLYIFLVVMIVFFVVYNHFICLKR